MFSKKIPALVFVALLFLAGTARAEEKNYLLTDLRQSVSNGPKCKECYRHLKQLTKRPVSLQYTKQSDAGDHTSKDLTGQLNNHSHTTLKQTVDGNRLRRVGAGEFELNGEKFHYVMEVFANLDNPDHRYLYPIIISCDEACCYYTALIKPTDETVAAFKKHIQSGAAEKGMDLHHQQ